jgi:hypothetical protein
VIAQGDAVLRQHHRGEFDVEADLEDARRFQYRLQRGQRIACLDLVRRQSCVEQTGAAAGLLVAERNVAGIARRQRQRHARHLSLHRIDRIRHRLDREVPDIMHPYEPRLELIEAADGLVFLAVERNLPDCLRPRGGERDRVALETEGFVFLAAFLRGRRGGAGKEIA